MPIVEIDTLQRVRDMGFDNGFGTSYFAPGRLTSIETGGQNYLVMASEGNGFGMATIASNGALDFVDAYGTSFDRLDSYSFGSNTIASIEKNGVSYVYLSGSATRLENNQQFFDTGLFVIKFDGTGAPEVIQHRDLTNAPQGYGTVSSFGSDPKIVNIGGRDILISSDGARTSSTNGTFETFQIRANGKLKPLESTEPFIYDFEKNDVVTVDGKTYVVAFGQFDIAPLQVLRLKRDGSLTEAYEVPTTDSAIYNRITSDLEPVEIGGRSFVVVPEVTAGTILVYEILGNGRLELIDQEVPSIGDQWGAPETVVAFEEDGLHYIATGGYGRSIAIFRMTEGGALHEVDEFQPATQLGRTYDLEARDIGGEQFLFSSSGALDEVRALRFVPIDDSINGNGGNNSIVGTPQDDLIFGLKGRDTLKGAAGDDVLEGGKGLDMLKGGKGKDSLFGGDGRDTLLGGDDGDFLFGDADDDSVMGQNGNDYAYGGAGDDTVTGGGGNDRVFGGNGDDKVKGGSGNDVLSDGKGKDSMLGGSGNDVFVFTKDNKRDKIQDFEDGNDRIDLTDYGRGLEFSDLTVTQNGNNVTVEVLGDTILVKSATGQIFDFQLSLGDFIFA
ncbi:calcium-binding protein [Sedimentitalea arenosa]|uniref:Calcium-binding protein n=1 Tax=Sedimentitalea arenosa TaxID=2798803 RepID=A0A8J7II22_9RHOB|nr:calcium-binding protein [Arenibacterium arenosum]MBJ6371012.1 hypothetical protein [Arenibacterium arenosum]